MKYSIDYNFKYRSYRVIFIDHEMEGEIFLSEINIVRIVEQNYRGL